MNIIFEAIFVAVIAVLFFVTVCPDIPTKIGMINVYTAVNNGDNNVSSLVVFSPCFRCFNVGIWQDAVDVLNDNIFT